MTTRALIVAAFVLLTCLENEATAAGLAGSAATAEGTRTADSATRTAGSADTGNTATAAAVLFAEGEVKIRGGTRSAPAEQGRELGPDDELIVGFESLLVIQLDNGHVVRVDEDLRLHVRDLALFGARPAGESLERQVARLFPSAEQRQVSERIVGFHARRSAGESLGARPAASSPAAEPAGELSAPRRAPRTRSTPRRAPAPTSAPPAQEEAAPAPSRRAPAPAAEAEAPAPTREAPAPSMEAPRPAPTGEAPAPTMEAPRPATPEEAPRAPTTWSWGLMREGRLEMRTDPLPRGLAALMPAGLDTCLIEGLPEEIQRGSLAEISLLLRVEESTVRTVAMDGALPVPACAREGLEGSAIELSELSEHEEPFWLVLRMPLN